MSAGARDLIGYGLTPPRVRWPNGAAVAVSLVVNFEEGAEHAIEAGDARGERIGEVLSVVADGVRDLGQEQLFAYGMRAGLPRFLRAFDDFGVKATFFMCGRAIERVPELARAVTAAGHEAACHGWRWRPHADYTDEAAEREDLVRCIETTRAVTGERPLGFFCRGSESMRTRALLRELGFFYTSNAFDDDLPYWDRADPAHPLLVMPYALDSNDMKFTHPNNFATAREWLEYVQNALEVLIAEGQAGTPKLLNLGLHLRIGGRPARFWGVLRLLEHLRDLGDRVWVARRIDIARHWAAQFPP